MRTLRHAVWLLLVVPAVLTIPVRKLDGRARSLPTVISDYSNVGIANRNSKTTEKVEEPEALKVEPQVAPITPVNEPEEVKADTVVAQADPEKIPEQPKAEIDTKLAAEPVAKEEVKEIPVEQPEEKQQEPVQADPAQGEPVQATVEESKAVETAPVNDAAAPVAVDVPAAEVPAAETATADEPAPQQPAEETKVDSPAEETKADAPAEETKADAPAEETKADAPVEQPVLAEVKPADVVEKQSSDGPVFVELVQPKPEEKLEAANDVLNSESAPLPAVETEPLKLESPVNAEDIPQSDAPAEPVVVKEGSNDNNAPLTISLVPDSYPAVLPNGESIIVEVDKENQ